MTMSTESTNHKPSNDKLHSSDLGETKDFNDLSFDEEKQSYELDVKGDDKEYDHPMPYETVATGSVDDDSTYDEANPYVGSEYDDEEQVGENMESAAMRIEDEENLELDPEDELLARTPEDDRDDLDEEGYPLNDRLPK